MVSYIVVYRIRNTLLALFVMMMLVVIMNEHGFLSTMDFVSFCNVLMLFTSI